MERPLLFCKNGEPEFYNTNEIDAKDAIHYFGTKVLHKIRNTDGCYHSSFRCRIRLEQLYMLLCGFYSSYYISAE